jgi:hypothetical protein
MPTPNHPSSNHRAQFIAARDTRNRRIPGLYIRGGRFYAQLWGCGRREESRAPRPLAFAFPFPFVSFDILAPFYCEH